MTLGQRIQELRKQNNLSQEALGEKLGVSRQAISRWEMDGAVPEVDKLIAMSKLFSVSLNDLLQVESGAGEETPQAVPAPVKRWKLGAVLLALLLALSLTSTAVLGWRVASLEERLTQLEGPPVDGDASVETMPAPLVVALEHTADWQPAPNGWAPNQENRTMYCSITLTAGRMTEGMTVTLQLVDKAGVVELVEMENTGGAVWSAVFSLNTQRGPFTCTALFQSGEEVETQPLIRWSDMSQGSYTWSEELLWEEGIRNLLRP